MNNLINTMKSREISDPSPHPRLAFVDWYNSSMTGQALQHSEKEFLLTKLQLTYKQSFLQVGALGKGSIVSDTLSSGLVIACGQEEDHGAVPGCFVKCAAANLPFRRESIDVVVLPHLLEFEYDPHPVLNEAARVLRSGGELFVFGMNAWSPARFVMRLHSGTAFIPSHSIGIGSMLAWLRALKFEARFDAGFGLIGHPGIYQTTSLSGRSVARLSAAYVIRAVKRSYNVIPLRTIWRQTPTFIPGQITETPLLRERK